MSSKWPNLILEIRFSSVNASYIIIPSNKRYINIDTKYSMCILRLMLGQVSGGLSFPFVSVIPSLLECLFQLVGHWYQFCFMS